MPKVYHPCPSPSGRKREIKPSKGGYRKALEIQQRLQARYPDPEKDCPKGKGSTSKTKPKRGKGKAKTNKQCKSKGGFLSC